MKRSVQRIKRKDVWYWVMRAEEMRTIADDFKTPETRRMLLDIAEMYESLARKAIVYLTNGDASDAAFKLSKAELAKHDELVTRLHEMQRPMLRRLSHEKIPAALGPDVSNTASRSNSSSGDNSNGSDSGDKYVRPHGGSTSSRAKSLDRIGRAGIKHTASIYDCTLLSP